MHLFLSVVGTVPKKKEESDSDDDALSTGFSGAKGRGLKRGKKPAKKKGRPPQGKKRKISLNRSLSDPTLAISEPISIDSLPAGEGIDVSALAPGPTPTSSSIVPAPGNPKAAEASPFETVEMELRVRADLPLVPNSILVKESRDQAWIHQEVEHRVSQHSSHK